MATSSEVNVGAMARLFRTLGDETRVRILIELKQGPTNVSDLCKKLKAAQPTVSHHLGILRMGELVTPRRSGKEIYYSLNEEMEGHKAAKSVQALLKRSETLRLGPIVLGLA